ncbi:hypothetical protein ACFQV2_14140 [Actinokineospora soli]|uniref:Uncharacterized protein n=1 Tax=Actinokineospora soli TaxID=1048753 RepID=A0ABW2TPM9_9PSEU
MRARRVLHDDPSGGTPSPLLDDFHSTGYSKATLDRRVVVSGGTPGAVGGSAGGGVVRVGAAPGGAAGGAGGAVVGGRVPPGGVGSGVGAGPPPSAPTTTPQVCATTPHTWLTSGATTGESSGRSSSSVDTASAITSPLISECPDAGIVPIGMGAAPPTPGGTASW